MFCIAVLSKTRCHVPSRQPHQYACLVSMHMHVLGNKATPAPSRSPAVETIIMASLAFLRTDITG